MSTQPGKRIAPGVYAVGDTMHVDAEELLAAAGYEPTPENVARLERAAAAMAADRGMRYDVDDDVPRWPPQTG